MTSTFSRVGACIAAALLLFFVSAALFAAPARASVRASGVPRWVADAAERSLGAVHEHLIESEVDASERAELLRVVANRLLPGYEATEISETSGDVTVRLSVSERVSVPEWRAQIMPPGLSAPVDSWFERDARGIAQLAAQLLIGVPMEAVGWADIDLKRQIDELCAPTLPGWRSSLFVRADPSNGSASLEIVLTPEQPLTLSVSPQITSTSIPIMLRSDLKGELMKGFAPVIGIPVPWLQAHTDDLVAMTQQILAGEYIVDAGKATAQIHVEPDSVSQMEIDIESRRYSTWVWMSVYAGADGRYPEAGVHIGRWVTPFSGLDVELYGEALLELNDWSIEPRLGAGWSPLRDLWIGAEWSGKDDAWWARIRYRSQMKHRPYAWLRLSGSGRTNGAIGIRVTDYLSFEVEYDSRYDDEINIKAIVNL